MSDIVVKVENVSKLYRLGVYGTGTLKEDIIRKIAIWRGKEDPTALVGSTNILEKTDTNNVLALNNVSFDIKQGEVLGIIGKNGAGKSTLLKVLSQITGPTKGSIKIKGKVASLLEVGTGMHPELTGRENIFLNGALLGMKKHEIKSQFDEIVDFAGIEKYIDTPIKRYSSGMGVRLGFAIASFLEPEILIVDEVLAVGDAEFQRKAIGKMKDISSQGGRTVFFVSHNMASINSLCTRVIHMKHGSIFEDGPTRDIVSNYLKVENDLASSISWNENEAPGDDEAKLLKVEMVDAEGKVIDVPEIDQKFGIRCYYQSKTSGKHKVPNIHVLNEEQTRIFISIASSLDILKKEGFFEATMWIPANLLNTEVSYIIGVALTTMIPQKVHYYLEAIRFQVVENNLNRTNDYNRVIPGFIRPQLEWEIQEI